MELSQGAAFPLCVLPLLTSLCPWHGLWPWDLPWLGGLAGDAEPGFEPLGEMKKALSYTSAFHWVLKVFCFLPSTPKVGLEGPSGSCGSPDESVEDAFSSSLWDGIGMPVAPYL